ncbi:hypothetical protein U0070_026179 [Myodes glareolus]|uniref:Uncharacterized protein n=1 Tax=Myodes glareolus TaxID=447135 RepID=A0AAW0HXN7_MYOGA
MPPLCDPGTAHPSSKSFLKKGNARDVSKNRKSPRGHQVNGAAESPILSGVPVLSSLDLATSNIILVNEARGCDQTSLSYDVEPNLSVSIFCAMSKQQK